MTAVREENIGPRHGDANPRNLRVALGEGKQPVLLRMLAGLLIGVVTVEADLFSRQSGIAAGPGVGVAIDTCQGRFTNVDSVVEGDGLGHRCAAPDDAIDDGATAPYDGQGDAG